MSDAVGFFASLVKDVGKGAAMGATLGPVGAGAGAAVAAVSDIADAVGLTKWLFGPGAAETKQAVVAAVAQATGTTNLDVQGAVLARDPEAAAALRVSLAGIAAAREQAADQARLETLRAELADTSNARTASVDYAKSSSILQWGAPVISVVTLVSYGVISGLAVWLTTRGDLPANAVAVLSLVLGAGASMATSVVGFWVGSSAGSQQKSDVIAKIAGVPPQG